MSGCPFFIDSAPAPTIVVLFAVLFIMTFAVTSINARKRETPIHRICYHPISTTSEGQQHPILFLASSNGVSSSVAYTAHLFHPRLTNSQTSRHATTGTAKSIRLATSQASRIKTAPPRHIHFALPCPNISIQRYSAWVCSRAMKNVQPAIAP